MRIWETFLLLCAGVFVIGTAVRTWELPVFVGFIAGVVLLSLIARLDDFVTQRRNQRWYLRLQKRDAEYWQKHHRFDAIEQSQRGGKPGFAEEFTKDACLWATDGCPEDCAGKCCRAYGGA